MTTRVIATNFDAYVSQARPGDNFGDERFLNLRNDTGQDRRAFLHFGLPDIKDATIVSATIVLYLKSNWAGTNNVAAQRITQSWRERRIAWNDVPNTTATNEGTATITGGLDGDALVIDVTAMLQQVANGANWFGVRLTNSNSSIRQLFSSEAVNSAKRPVLALEWASPPEAPTNLRPRGEQAISEAAPLLLWESAQPYESKVQIATVEDFSSGIVYDSGYVSNDETQWQTTASLADNNNYFWRVRIRDASGVESDWSDAAEFDRRTKGSLTITDPAADNDDVESTSPVIEHTFSGRTQKEVEYELRENDTLIYTRSRFPTTATSFTLPASNIRDADADYTITIRVWDTHNRQTIGDDTAYVQASRVFQFASTVDVAPPVDLAASDEGGHVLLTWDRLAEPDYFALKVDGVVVFDRIDPALITVTTDPSLTGWGEGAWGSIPWGDPGTATYAFKYFRAVPRREHTYEIQAVVDTGGILKHSDDNPTIAHTFRPIGIWLADETDATEMVFLDTQDVPSELGESGGTFYPIGRRDPVRVVDGIRGYEGTVGGRLLAYDDLTAEDLKDTLEDLKGRRAPSLRLTYAYRNIPIQIGAATIQPLPTGEEAYSASVEYSQVGEFSVEGV